MQVFARYLTGVFNARNNRVTLSSSFANYWWWYKHYFLAVGSEEGDSLDPKASDDAKALMMWVKSVLAKYWILLCCGAFLLVGLQNEVSVYQIGYMAIFLFILICYQVSRSYICINYFSGYQIYIYIYIYIYIECVEQRSSENQRWSRKRICRNCQFFYLICSRWLWRPSAYIYFRHLKKWLLRTLLDLQYNFGGGDGSYLPNKLNEDLKANNTIGDPQPFIPEKSTSPKNFI